jgi:hypothetical protein
MGEQEPQPPLHENCRNCGEGYLITQFNACLYFFTKQPEIIILDSTCTSCKVPDAGYVNRETAEWALDAGIYASHLEWASVEVHGNFLENMGVKLVLENDITPRQDTRSDWFGYELANGIITPEDFNGKGELFI